MQPLMVGHYLPSLNTVGIFKRKTWRIPVCKSAFGVIDLLKNISLSALRAGWLPYASVLIIAGKKTESKFLFRKWFRISKNDVFRQAYSPV